ncbi:hypothetical protein ACFFHM_01695 [Halalkalibacter kiskunsagensis]|uniref:Uncharacterized protein n=1 Tax=Halalkalibacter kiskunsagensis TaxID=1548599 RepID=A0ABV6K7I8_9BACI
MIGLYVFKDEELMKMKDMYFSNKDEKYIELYSEIKQNFGSKGSLASLVSLNEGSTRTVPVLPCHLLTNNAELMYHKNIAIV